MLSEHTERELKKAVGNAEEYGHGTKRRILQALFDKAVNEMSENLFNEPCSNRMGFRKQVNCMSLNELSNKQTEVIKALRLMLKDQQLLFAKDYRDHRGDIELFLTNHVQTFLTVLEDGD